MGSVSIDIYRKEKDFKQLTLSDKNVVRYLLLHRSTVDVSYGVGNNIDINVAGDLHEFNQELIALYVSIDNLIDECKFREKQKKLLHLLFEGNDIYDIVNMDIGYGKSATYDLFERIVCKIVDKNDELWRNYMKKRFSLEVEI